MALRVPRNDGTVQHFDKKKGVVIHHCPACQTEQEWTLDQLRFVAHDLADPTTWSLALPDCPECAKKTFGPNCPVCGRNDPHKHAVSHFLNCSLPDDHPHPSAKTIKELLIHLKTPRLIEEKK